MNGSTVLVGGMVRLGAGQHKSKSDGATSLVSTKYLYIVWRPSSISGWAEGLTPVFLTKMVSDTFGGASSSAADLVRLLALLSIWAMADMASASSGWRWRIVSYSRMAEESWPNCT